MKRADVACADHPSPAFRRSRRAAAHAAEIIRAATEQGRAILGVVDDASPKGVEGDDDIAWRRDLLRKIGYKL